MYERRLFGEELSNILEGFKFQCIPRRVQEEHGSLFAGEAFEADIGLDDEFDAVGF